MRLLLVAALMMSAMIGITPGVAAASPAQLVDTPAAAPITGAAPEADQTLVVFSPDQMELIAPPDLTDVNLETFDVANVSFAALEPPVTQADAAASPHPARKRATHHHVRRLARAAHKPAPVASPPETADAPPSPVAILAQATAPPNANGIPTPAIPKPARSELYLVTGVLICLFCAAGIYYEIRGRRSAETTEARAPRTEGMALKAKAELNLARSNRVVAQGRRTPPPKTAGIGTAGMTPPPIKVATRPGDASNTTSSADSLDA